MGVFLQQIPEMVQQVLPDFSLITGCCRPDASQRVQTLGD